MHVSLLLLELVSYNTMLATIQLKTQPTLSQLWSFKSRPTTFLNCLKFADLIILRLQSFERIGRVLKHRVVGGEVEIAL